MMMVQFFRKAMNPAATVILIRTHINVAPAEKPFHMFVSLDATICHHLLPPWIIRLVVLVKQTKGNIDKLIFASLCLFACFWLSSSFLLGQSGSCDQVDPSIHAFNQTSGFIGKAV